MNTQKQVHQLQAGEALALSGSTLQVVLVEGEVLFQPAALYLAGTVIVPPARRMTAPAKLPSTEDGSLTAVGNARIVTEKPLGLLESFSAWWERPRAGLVQVPPG